MLLSQLQPPRAIELAHHHCGTAIGHGGHKNAQRGVGVHRRRQQRHLTRYPQATLLSHRHLIPTHLATVHDAFWRACRAAGINDVVGVIGASLDIKRCRTLIGHPIEQKRRAIRVVLCIHHHVLEGRQRDATVGELRALNVIDKQVPCATVSHHGGKLLWGCRGG